MVLSTHGALLGFNVRFYRQRLNMDFYLSLLCLLLPSSFLSSSFFLLVLYSVMSLIRSWCFGVAQSSHLATIRLFFPSGLHAWQHNNTKVLVRAQLQKQALNSAVIMMYSLQDIDVRRCHPPPVYLGYLCADSRASAAPLHHLVSCPPGCVRCILKA